MEQKHQKTLTDTLNINSLTPHNIFLILSFLDSDSINAIIQADTHHNHKKFTLFSIARNLHFLHKYLNKTDRSNYMPFYSQSLFVKMEQQQLSHICSQSDPVVKFLSDSFKDVFSHLRKQLGDFQLSIEILESITESLTDPQLPFPKLRKQNIGMHCNSSFQFFLVDKLFPGSEQDTLQQTFEELGIFLSDKWSLNQQNEQKELQIIQQVFSSWFKISYQNYTNYLIHKNANHNLVVIIVATLDLLIDLFCFYIESIWDPLYAFIEFNMRYCLFRNIILSLQQKLGFLFKNYSSFYEHISAKKNEMKMQDQSQPQGCPRQMTIWHCGLSKWYIYMQRYHENYSKSFFYLLKKINLQTIKIDNNQKIKNDKTFIELQNRLDLNETELLEKQEFFDVYSPIQDIFQEKRELYDQVIKEYMEYIIDISINEYSVHWCGHSAQVLHIPYQEFQNYLLQDFKQYFFKIINLSREVNNPIIAIDNTIKSIICQLDRQYLKPVTLKKIAAFTEFQIISYFGEDEYKKSQLFQTLKDLFVQFQSKDSVLNHFNSMLKISNETNEKYSIVLQSEDFNKALKTSATTTASRNNNLNLINSPVLNAYDSLMQQDFI